MIFVGATIKIKLISQELFLNKDYEASQRTKQDEDTTSGILILLRTLIKVGASVLSRPPEHGSAH